MRRFSTTESAHRADAVFQHHGQRRRCCCSAAVREGWRGGWSRVSLSARLSFSLFISTTFTSGFPRVGYHQSHQTKIPSRFNDAFSPIPSCCSLTIRKISNAKRHYLATLYWPHRSIFLHLYEKADNTAFALTFHFDSYRDGKHRRTRACINKTVMQSGKAAFCPRFTSPLTSAHCILCFCQ